MNAEAPIPFPQSARMPEEVSFDRRELGQILRVYGRMVAAGEWRDYGMSFGRESASFAIFRRTAENPLYRIEKHPKLRQKQGMYVVFGSAGQAMRRGHELAPVLKVLERKLIRLIE